MALLPTSPTKKCSKVDEADARDPVVSIPCGCTAWVAAGLKPGSVGMHAIKRTLAVLIATSALWVSPVVADDFCEREGRRMAMLLFVYRTLLKS